MTETPMAATSTPVLTPITAPVAAPGPLPVGGVIWSTTPITLPQVPRAARPRNPQHAWVTALRVVGWVSMPFFFAMGILAYFQVIDLTRTLNTIAGGFFGRGTPNIGMAVLAMLSTWLIGACVAIGMMVYANVAADVRSLKTSAEARDQRG